MQTIEEGALVIAHCMAPKERLWGLLLRLDATGAVIRGLDLNSVEDWLRQEREGAERLIGPSTQFIPMHRVERIYLDESSGIAEGIGDRFSSSGKGDVRAALTDGP